MGCNCDFIMKMMKFIEEKDFFSKVFWEFKKEPEFYVKCDGLFWMDNSDSEKITEKDFDLFQKSIYDAGEDGIWLYCARKKKMRPQGAAYKNIDEKNYKFFDQCGNHRMTGHGNPEER